jgi:hypothetical protein
MANSTYFQQQVERCLRLSRMCSDNTVSERLRQMAAEFQEQAEQLAENAMPAGVMARNGAGDRSRN